MRASWFTLGPKISSDGDTVATIGETVTQPHQPDPMGKKSSIFKVESNEHYGNILFGIYNLRFSADNLLPLPRLESALMARMGRITVPC